MKILHLYSLHIHDYVGFYASFKIQHPATDCMIAKTSMAVCMCPWIIYICVPNCVCECNCLRRLICTHSVNLSLTPQSFSIFQVSTDLSHSLMPPLKGEAK